MRTHRIVDNVAMAAIEQVKVKSTAKMNKVDAEIMQYCIQNVIIKSNHFPIQHKSPTVYITDNASMVFGGSDAPLALGCVYSLGAINMENNGKIQSGVTDILEKYGVTESRIYINFFDMPRENVGWNRATFAG